MDAAANRHRHALGLCRSADVLIILFIALSIASPAFLTTRNLFNILDQSAPVGIIACAATLVIIAGGFDLSAGAIFALAGVLAAKVANETDPATGMLVALLVATVLGLFNGLLVSGFQINPLRGHLGDRHDDPRLGSRDHEWLSRHGPDERYTIIGRDGFLGVKFSVWLFAVFAAICGFLFAHQSSADTSTPSAATPRPRASPASVSAG